MTRWRRNKTSPQKGSLEQPIRQRIVKRLKKQRSVGRPKGPKVERHHHKKLRRPVTFGEFLPSWFYAEATQDNVEASCFCADKGQTMNEDSSKVSLANKDELVGEIPSKASPSSSEKSVEPPLQEVHAFSTKISFTDDDLLFGETLHNRPLYMVGHVLKKKIDRILIDEGFGVSIIPIHTLKELGITTGELSESHLLIQGFN